MENRSLVITFIVAVTVLAIAFMVIMANKGPNDGFGNVIGTNTQTLGVATTSESNSVTVSERILATTTNPTDATGNYNRYYATVCNPNANPVYLNLDEDKPATAASVTVVIAAAAGYDACYSFTNYHGSVTASSTNGTATTISVKQYVRQ